MIKLKKQILQTLAYSDIFDYPLTSGEIWRFLISDKTTSKNSINQLLVSHLSSGKTIIAQNGYYCFADRKSVINKRMQREKESGQKMLLAKKIAFYLFFIPTIQLIGVSGALAMKNSDKNDDIDLFIVTKKNSLWTTRLLTIFILQFLGRRRKRSDKNAPNKICLNMLLDETALCLPRSKQNLFSAHEVVQLVPLFDRQNSYQKFLQANEWVGKYLYNSLKHRNNQSHAQKKKETTFGVILCSLLRSSALVVLIKYLQLWYMKGHITKETVSDNLLAFHPKDYKDIVLSQYEKKLKKYKI